MHTLSRRFELVLIKPSHYDDDGYVIQWLRSLIPSNSLAALYGVASDCAQRQVLGPDVEIVTTIIDETNTRIVPKHIVRQIRRAGMGLVGLVGVQTNQFPRAIDIARALRAAGVPVVASVFASRRLHVNRTTSPASASSDPRYRAPAPGSSRSGSPRRR